MDHSRIQPGTSRHIDFFVAGVAVQQGSKTLGKNRATGAAVMYESAKGLAQWRGRVIAAARVAMGPGWVPLDGPLYLDIRFWMPRPGSHPKSIATFPTSPPDADKLVRAIGDSLTQAKLIADDARIIDLSASERYAGGPMHPTAEVGAGISVGMIGAIG